MKILAVLRDVLIIIVLAGFIIWLANRRITQYNADNAYLNCVWKSVASPTYDYSSCERERDKSNESHN
jgi:hypothetical protein